MDSATEQTAAHALDEFETAWADPRYTTVQLPVLDVNRILADRYRVEPPTRMTGSQLWDMEIRKAWDPVTYIPYVASEGHSWARTELPGNGLRHLRHSIQKAWLRDEWGQVLEEVVADADSRRVLFLGRAQMIAADGTTLHADPYQPLFHVEHAVGGTEETPTNLWRIVVLTAAPDERYQHVFDAMTSSGLLPGFVELYLTHDLGVTLHRR